MIMSGGRGYHPSWDSRGIRYGDDYIGVRAADIVRRDLPRCGRKER